MYDMPNRRERRKLAKQLGLLKKRSQLPLKDYLEELRRSQLAGEQIHRAKTEEMLRRQEEDEAASDYRKNAESLLEDKKEEN